MSWTNNKIKEEAQKDPNFMMWFEEETNKLDIAVTMTNLRVGLGLTQREFAERVGKELSLITRIESGELIPSFKLINEIAHAVWKNET
ncbi:helix-turn-helix domain-containing protein [Lactococcus lactis]|uniref:helix-turn-helix domain-containing protein n=1 Tax=Lactococcus lactis TaxID=1358 RepID=UPI001913FA3D|nr:helix-turn-helix transcriptional regulator [Lactococcus lactis]WDA67510.1 helix-turn-helix transcriptional regulator [Lactococcus lactis]WDA67531.1 helix-turn-helix transcriptional regulator [Lactococcus lactis]